MTTIIMKTVQLFALLGVLLSSPAFAGSSKAAEPTKMPTVFQNPLLLYYAQKQAANYVKSDFDGVDPSDTGTLLKIIIKQAAADAGNRAWQAATDIKAKIDKVSLTGANEWIWQAATDVQDAYDHMDSTDLGKWLKQASQDVGLNATLRDLRAVKYEDLPADALEYIKNNPAQTVFYIVNGVALFSPATVWGPLLGVLGFSPAGVGAGPYFSSFYHLMISSPVDGMHYKFSLTGIQKHLRRLSKVCSAAPYLRVVGSPISKVQPWEATA